MKFDLNKSPCRWCGYWTLPNQLLKKNRPTYSCNSYTFPCWFWRLWADKFLEAINHKEKSSEASQ